MKELLLLSGKGGTGKTSVAGSFAALCRDAILVDCDVDAANLHLIVQHREGKGHEFTGSKKAVISDSKCSRCGKCASVCRFEAVGKCTAGYAVNAMSCEGCGLCARVCPEGAVEMVDRLSGYWFESRTPYGPLIHARLLPGEGNSGRLVTLLRERARRTAGESGRDMIIMDGPPGIGCPAIASMAGVSLALLVVEPTVAGFHDFRRILEVCRRFGVATAACINKYDLDEKTSQRIEERCRKNGVVVLGRIPTDHDVTRATVRGIPVVEHSTGPAATALRQVWERTREALSA